MATSRFFSGRRSVFCGGAWFFRGCSCGAFDKSGGEVELTAEGGLAGGHFSVVGLVVFSGEMEKAMEEEDFNLFG